MATVTEYLLVSSPEAPEAVQSHPLLAEHDFDLQSQGEGEGTVQSLKFVVTHPLEDDSSLEERSREISTEFPEATIIFCEVEERFEQVEHFRSVVFIEGKQAGEIDHGYVLNIGG